MEKSPSSTEGGLLLDINGSGGSPSSYSSHSSGLPSTPLEGKSSRVHAKEASPNPHTTVRRDAIVDQYSDSEIPITVIDSEVSGLESTIVTVIEQFNHISNWKEGIQE